MREDKSVPIFKCLHGHLSLYCNGALHNVPCWTCSLTYVCAFSVTLKWLGDTSVSTEADRFMWNNYGTKHINNSWNRESCVLSNMYIWRTDPENLSHYRAPLLCIPSWKEFSFCSLEDNILEEWVSEAPPSGVFLYWVTLDGSLSARGLYHAAWTVVGAVVMCRTLPLHCRWDLLWQAPYLFL